MSEDKRRYKLDHIIIVNELIINEIIIDPHVDKHSDHVSDELVLSLIDLLNGNSYVPVSQKDGYSYFVTNIQKANYTYRVVWIQEEGCLYIGVITAFRDKGAK